MNLSILKILSSFKKRHQRIFPAGKITYNMKLTVKAVIRVEQFLGKPFGALDYTNEKDINVLLYCVMLSNSNMQITFDEFLHISGNEQQLKTMLVEFERYNKIIAQFQSKKDDPVQDNTEPSYLKDLIATLIVQTGMDAGYVLNDMLLSDINIYVEALERKKKEQMEAGRLWTYLTLLPHVDNSKLKSPKDLYMFPWEEEQSRIEAQREIEESKSRFYEFIKKGKPINNN